MSEAEFQAALERFKVWAGKLTPEELEKLAKTVWEVRNAQYAEWDERILGKPAGRVG